MKTWWYRLLPLLFLALAGCGRDKREVVVYTSLDDQFAREILDRFTAETGITARPVFDTESSKSVGLTNRLIAEAGTNPRCDVFWNNEIVNTLRLQQRGLLAELDSPALAPFPAPLKDARGRWTGFAARARVFLVNTDLVPDPAADPTSIAALADPRWKGKGGMARPLAGTTATHAACLFAALGEEEARAFFRALKENEVRLFSGNKTTAQAVSRGEICFGLTDTDDAIIELREENAPVRIVFPDAVPGRPGVLYIPNTVSLVRDAPHPAAGRRLVEFLLSPAVEAALARGDSAQIPLNPRVTARPAAQILTPAQRPALDIDFAAAAAAFEAAAEYLQANFVD